MDAERISSLQTRLRTNRLKVRTDEAARSALILPFIQSLGYDIFDPDEVLPSFTRGQGRADFVVFEAEQPRIVISLAQNPADLTADRAVRLAECFANVGATAAILTDGSLYRVHTDADQPGKMDEEPLLSVDLGGEAAVDPSVLTGLTKEGFDIASLATAAKARRYDEAVRRAVGDELADPSETFVDIISNRMRAAGFEPQGDIFQKISAIALWASAPTTGSEGALPAADALASDERVMTADEMLGYHIIRALAAKHNIDASRITARPAQSYCAILLDDNNRKSVGRLHFNSQTVKYLGTFVDKKETRRQITGPNAIYDLEAQIVDRLRELDPKAFGLAETAASRSRDEQSDTLDEETQDEGGETQISPVTPDIAPVDPVLEDEPILENGPSSEPEAAAVVQPEPRVETHAEPEYRPQPVYENERRDMFPGDEVREFNSDY